MVTVVSVTSSRADIGILSPVWQALLERGADLSIFATGMHLTDRGRAQLADHPLLAGRVGSGRVVFGGADIGGADPLQCAGAMAEIQTAAADAFATLSPDVVFVVGDRLDMFPAAVATVPFNLPLVHLHGGEFTEGALDDRLRHALTKLAHFHCASNTDAAANIVAMGEEPWRVDVTGAPGIDTLIQAEEMSSDAFGAAVKERAQCGRDLFNGSFRLVTVHPETNADAPLTPLRAVLEALDERPAPTLFTAPNSDPRGAEAYASIQSFVRDRDWTDFVDTLGSALYAPALRRASMMIGNSSSGIIEAGIFGLPVIDVGGRQAGRIHGDNVAHAEARSAQIVRRIDAVETRAERFPMQAVYGDGKAGPRIAEVLMSVPSRADILVKKGIHRA